jgi:nicotinamide riboside transporter PnuC
MFEVFKWGIAFLSLAGVVLNIRKRRECFFIWAFTNLSWAAVDVYHGIYSQAALQSVYFILAIWGIREWRKTDTQSS